MRFSLSHAALVAATLAASGCSLFDSGPEAIRRATVVSASVEALPLGQVWDRDVFGPNGPDVFVEVRRIDTTAPGGSASAFRTHSAPDTERADLPLTLTPRDPVLGTTQPLGVEDRVIVAIYDDDTFGENDLMFASDTLRLATRIPSGDVPGDERTLAFEGSEARVRLRVRWEAAR